MNIDKSKTYVRDAEHCALCGKMMCFEDAYYWKFANGGFFVCADCNKKKSLMVLEKMEQPNGEQSK